MTQLVRTIDERLIPRLRRWSIPTLRYALAIVFIWFGALKIADVTPVEELVRSTIYWIEGDWVVPALGVVEVLVGIGLAVGKPIRLVLLVVVAQMAGTFLVFVIRPEVTFSDGNILQLTTEGEFILKNLVLLSAAFVVGSAIEPGRELDDTRMDLSKREP